MQWETRQVFEILAVGDGYFMRQVLTAVAMMWSNGIYASLGALGLLVGLLMTGAQGIASGGQRLDLGSLFTGFIMWAVMFGGGSTVVINEVGFTRPGSNGQQSYIVEAVPFGVAAAGWLISNVGQKMTATMEQAYGIADEPTSVLQTGNGRSLEWLAAVRLAKNINVGSNDNKFAVMRANLISYLRYCSSQAVVRDPDRTAVMPYTADPLDTQRGFGFDSEWVPTDWYTFVPNDKPTLSEKSCRKALNDPDGLRAYFQGGDSYKDFANTVARPMKFGGSGTPEQQATEAAAALNMPLDHAQKYMLGTMIAGLWSESISGSPLLTDAQVANRIMITQAVEQRATEAAGEENMFRRTMFPLMTFLECTLYICAPFMALALGLGKLGLGVSMKFGMTALWLALWLPTLAVINMFQITSFDSSYQSLIDTFTGAEATYEIGSLAASTHIEESVMDWMATGSMLAAATPLISLMFLTGSAFSATSLAGAFKGGDVLNEKVPSPDIATNSPAMGRTSVMQHSGGAGTTQSGAAVPTFDFSSSRTLGETSGTSSASSAMAQWSSTQGRQVATETAFSMMAGVRGSEQNSERAELASHKAVSALQGQGVDFGSSTDVGKRMAMQFSESLGGQASTDLLGGMKGKLAGMSPSALAGAARDTGTKVHAGMTQQDMVSAIADNVTRMASQVRAATQKDDGVRAAVTGANVATSEQFAAIQGSEVSKVANMDDLRKVGQAAESFQASHAKTEGWNAAVSSGHRVDAGQMVQMLKASGQDAQSLTALAHSVGVSEDALKAGTNANMSWATSGDQARMAAAVQAMSGHMPGYTGGGELGTSQQREALAGVLSDAGIIDAKGAAAHLNKPEGNAGVAPGAEAAGQAARGAVEGGGVGVGDANAVASQVKQDVGALQTPGGRAGFTAALGDMGLPVGRAEAGGARGASMNAGGNNIDGGAFAPYAAPIEAQSNTNQAELHGRAQAAQEGGISEQNTRNMAADNALVGHAGTASSWQASSAGGFPMTAGAGGGVLGGEFGTSGVDNPLVSQMVANIANGQWSDGAPIDANAATVMGTYAAVNAGGGMPSPEQGAQYAAAMASLSPNQRAAVNNVLNSMEGNGVPDPGEVTASSIAGLAKQLTFDGGAPAPVDTSAAPAPVPSERYSTSAPGSSASNMEHVNFRAEGGKSPAEYSMGAYEGAFSGHPKQGEGGNPVGAWQQGRDEGRAAAKAARDMPQNSDEDDAPEAGIQIQNGGGAAGRW